MLQCIIFGENGINFNKIKQSGAVNKNTLRMSLLHLVKLLLQFGRYPLKLHRKPKLHRKHNKILVS